MNEHTPVPWKVYTDGTKTFVVSTATGRVVAADLYDENNEPSIEELDANARLIAAAPELLQSAETAEPNAASRSELRQTPVPPCA